MNDGVDYPGGHDSLINLVQHWSTQYSTDQKIPPILHSGCAQCEFRSDPTSALKSGFHECLKEVTGLSEQQIHNGTVLDIWNYRSKDSLLSQGIYKLEQVTEEDINIKNDQDGLSNSQRQWIQCSGIPPTMDMGGFYLDKEYLSNEYAKWIYPFHIYFSKHYK